MLQFIFAGGTKYEIFEHYYDKLVRSMKVKYPNKKLVFVLDNLRAHKSSLIMKIQNNEDRCTMLFTPSSSPELSPIENMFAYVKRILSKMILPSKPEEFAGIVTQ